LSLERAKGKELLHPSCNMELVVLEAYALCRHPITFGFIIVIVGFALTFDFVPLLLTAVSYPFFLYALLWYEEREHEMRFGEAYIKYKESTPMFPIPFRNRAIQ
jgi:protein-S-isoprenylcysteine O-methyltransferase Ste14